MKGPASLIVGLVALLTVQQGLPPHEGRVPAVVCSWETRGRGFDYAVESASHHGLTQEDVTWSLVECRTQGVKWIREYFKDAALGEADMQDFRYVTYPGEGQEIGAAPAPAGGDGT
jgi:hypothetical protein